MPDNKIDPVIFRAYDIRGTVGETLHEYTAEKIGSALVAKLSKACGKANPVVAVGRDGRLSSPAMHQNLVKGMVTAGAIVKDIGIGPTPMLYFAVRSLKLDGGVMITGSHNPPSHNGFKMMYAKAPLFGDEIQQMREAIESGDLPAVSGGSVEQHDVRNDYITILLSAIEPENQKKLSNMKVAWDPGNGAGGEITAMLVEELAGEHFLINEKIDGTFPAHHPDPSDEKNLVQLQQIVAENGCDVGIALDGDADRVGAIDDKGRVIQPDNLMMFFSEDVLKYHPNAEIIVDVKCSEAFFDYVRKLGGKPLMWRTGHSFIKNKLAETGAPLAGEMSGHIFFADKYFGYDDAIYAAVRLLNFIAGKAQKTSALINSLPQSFASSEYRIAVPEEDKTRIVEEIRAKVKALGKQVSEIDGIRVKENGGWWLLRSSNTQAVISLRAESTSQQGLTEIKNLLASYLAPYGLSDKII